MLDVGAVAPDFTLVSSDGENVSLSDYRGKPVMLMFYPWSYSGVCSGEVCELRDNLSMFEAPGVQLLAISADSKFVQARFAEDEKLNFPVLSDAWPHGETARAYGVFNDGLGCANRVSYLIDRNGVIIDRFLTGDIGSPRHLSAYADALAKL